MWVSASLSVLAISLCGVFGVLVVPIMQRVFYQHLIQFLVALAVGTLAGNGLMINPVLDDPIYPSHPVMYPYLLTT